MALVADVVDLVERRTTGRLVTEVRLRVGALTGVLPDAMRFCFELATSGTRLDGAALVLETEPGRIACRSCGAESPCDDHVLLCGCGSADVAVVAGDDLVVTSVALRKESACA